MRIYFLMVCYNGIHFNGSQIQGDLPTVQGFLNKNLSILLRTPIETYGSSRTDEGVHAFMNVYHFLFEEKKMIPNLKYKLNSILPHSLSVSDIFSAEDTEKNCRFDALSRRYVYKIAFKKNPFLHQRAYFFPYKLTIDLLNQTAEIIKEYKHFSTFSKKNSQSFTDICHIKNSYWEETEFGLQYIVEANRFLRGMVRALVGTQLHVGRGNYDTNEFRRRIEALDCQLADFSVPGHGLYLDKINYPEGYFDRKEE